MRKRDRLRGSGGAAASPAPQAGAGGSGDPLLADAESFAFGIGNGMIEGNAAEVADRLGDYDVVVVDGEEASAAKVSALKAEGAIVLAYLSVGTIEKWRGWYDDDQAVPPGGMAELEGRVVRRRLEGRASATRSPTRSRRTSSTRASTGSSSTTST